MDATIKPINNKVSMFASEQELEDKLTKEERRLIKLVKAEEFVQDLFYSSLLPQTHNEFPPENYYNKIKVLLKELRELNR